MDQTIEYTLRVVDQLKAQAANNGIEIEISRQRGDGHHLFEFMGKVRKDQCTAWIDATRLLRKCLTCSCSPIYVPPGQ